MSAHILLQTDGGRHWRTFRNPLEIYTAHQVSDVLPRLHEIERMVERHGLYAVGFLSYEASSAFDAALQTHTSNFPLLWFGLFTDDGAPTATPPIADLRPFQLEPWQPSVTPTEYDAAIDVIKERIARGDTYQVNYSYRLRAPFVGDALALFSQLQTAQQGQYMAYLDLGDYVICSASPELFFTLNGVQIVSRPMKGTMARSAGSGQDAALAQQLLGSVKNRAENVMIVDMIRNDLGRIAEIGTVKVPHLFAVEPYPTLWQMTSTVTASSRAPFSEIMGALFPCASITGAPKASTMDIIQQIEPLPRHIYTGSIGYLAPQRQAQFNVAIRTVLIDRTAGQAEYGVGGAIVWDSTSADEYQECQTKAKVVMMAQATRTEKQTVEAPGCVPDRQQFELLETILWTPDDGYFLLDYHLRRIAASAFHFGYPCDVAQVGAELQQISHELALQNEPQKVRLLIDEAGKIVCQFTPAGTLPNPARLKISTSPIDSDNPFLYHKTTQRDVYNEAKARFPEHDDVLLWNERHQVTEACSSNIVVKFGETLVTPPVACGLLGGTYRALLLDQGKIEERVISLDQIQNADAVYLINSVRKWRSAELVW